MEMSIEGRKSRLSASRNSSRRWRSASIFSNVVPKSTFQVKASLIAPDRRMLMTVLVARTEWGIWAILPSVWRNTLSRRSAATTTQRGWDTREEQVDLLDHVRAAVDIDAIADVVRVCYRKGQETSFGAGSAHA